MERFLQYWDDLDDLVGIIGLYAENLRRAFLFALATLSFFGGVCGAAILAFFVPPVGLGLATMLLVILMYRSVTAPHPIRLSVISRA